MRNANCSEKFLFEEMEIGEVTCKEHMGIRLISVDVEKMYKGVKTYKLSIRDRWEYNLSITVGGWTPILSYWELDEKQSKFAREEFDYLFEDVNLEEDDVDGSFFQDYAGELCDMNVYMRVPETSVWHILGFDGVHSPSYYTNNVVKISECGTSVRFGYCYTF